MIPDESVLRRPIGSEADVAEQFEHIAELAKDDRVLVQALPFGARAHALPEGNLTVMTFVDAPPVAYGEGPFSGELPDDPAVAGKREASFDQARASAPSPDVSPAVIESAVKEYGRGCEA